MKKVETTIVLKNKYGKPSRKHSDWLLNIHNLPQVKEEIIQQWLKNPDADELELACKITSKFQFKSNMQLGYLHAEILKKWYKYMEEEGDDSSDDQKKLILKTHPQIHFTDKVKDVTTGKIMSLPRSFASASKEEMSDIIDKLIRLGADFGIEFEDPEAYKKRKGLNKDWKKEK